MNKTNPDYFNMAQSWADERNAANARSRQIAWTIAIIAVVVAMLQAVALAVMMPLKTIVPMAVLVDRTTGHVERVNLDQMNQLTAGEALKQSMLAQYIIARESYDPISIAATYRKVALWSGQQARTSYFDGMKQNPPSTRLKSMGRAIGFEANIKSISMLNSDSALVRFDVAQINMNGRRENAQPFVATMSFGFRASPARIEDRLDNPLGFQVINYRVSPESAPRQDAQPLANAEIPAP